MSRSRKVSAKAALAALGATLGVTMAPVAQSAEPATAAQAPVGSQAAKDAVQHKEKLQSKETVQMKDAVLQKPNGVVQDKVNPPTK